MKARRLVGFLMSAFILLGTQNARADYLAGHIIDQTFISDGVLIRLDTGTPAVCTGTPYGWMLVKNQNSAMIIAVSIIWSEKRDQTNDRQVQVYSDGISGGFCLLNQIDPID